MRKTLFLFSLCLAFGHLLSAAAQTPWELERRTRSGILGVPDLPGTKGAAGVRPVKLYDESHALVIGMSNYHDSYWGDLPGVVGDVEEVSKALREHGFKVEPLMNLTGGELLARLEEFIGRHGTVEQNRLVIYYAGHGYRTNPGAGGREEGYIVPVNASAPAAKGPEPFAAGAINMSRIIALAAKIRSKHALLVLDSCFSGSLINAAQEGLPAAAGASAGTPARLTIAREGQTADELPPHPHPLPPIPPRISTNAEERAHLFITSGTDRQVVDDKSEFRRKFVQALTDESGSGADLNGDSYVTGDELGSYLYNDVTDHSLGRQRPRHGFLGGQAANPGDFIFVLPGAYAKEVPVGPDFEPGLWNIPAGWSFVKEKGKGKGTGKGQDRLLAEGPGVALPKDLVRHSFHDFSFVTRLRLTNNTAAGFVLRAQGPQDYYLVSITGNNARNKDEKFRVEAFAVRGGVKEGLAGSPIKIDHPDVELRLNREALIQVEIEATGNQLKVTLSAAEGSGSGFPLVVPLVFSDERQTFRYGAAGYLIEGKERFKAEFVGVAKLQKKGRV
ncbi:MAG TPA: caspase family protein [Pyrinomonadaceae bacterium]